MKAKPRGNILVVNGYEASRNLYRLVLERNGYHVVTAMEGDSAIRQVAQHGPDLDLVVTEFLLHDQECEAFINQVRALQADLPCLGIARSWDEHIRERFTKIPRCSLILTPNSIYELLDQVESILEIYPRRPRAYISPTV